MTHRSVLRHQAVKIFECAMMRCARRVSSDLKPFNHIKQTGKQFNFFFVPPNLFYFQHCSLFFNHNVVHYFEVTSKSSRCFRIGSMPISFRGATFPKRCNKSKIGSEVIHLKLYLTACKKHKGDLTIDTDVLVNTHLEMDGCTLAVRTWAKKKAQNEVYVCTVCLKECNNW